MRQRGRSAQRGRAYARYSRRGSTTPHQLPRKSLLLATFHRRKDTRQWMAPRPHRRCWSQQDNRCTPRPRPRPRPRHSRICFPGRLGKITLLRRVERKGALQGNRTAPSGVRVWVVILYGNFGRLNLLAQRYELPWQAWLTRRGMPNNRPRCRGRQECHSHPDTFQADNPDKPLLRCLGPQLFHRRIQHMQPYPNHCIFQLHMLGTHPQCLLVRFRTCSSCSRLHPKLRSFVCLLRNPRTRRCQVMH